MLMNVPFRLNGNASRLNGDGQRENNDDGSSASGHAGNDLQVGNDRHKNVLPTIDEDQQTAGFDELKQQQK